MPKHPDSGHEYNPNAEFEDDSEATMYWTQFSDFYDWPHITYFDNATHLVGLLMESDLSDVSRNMKRENEIRKNVLLGQWCDVIKNIPVANDGSKT